LVFFQWLGERVHEPSAEEERVFLLKILDWSPPTNIPPSVKQKYGSKEAGKDIIAKKKIFSDFINTWRTPVFLPGLDFAKAV
jgi:hypothetical protein